MRNTVSRYTSLFALLCCLAVLATGCASSGGKVMVPPVVGTWNLLLETPMGNQEPTFTVMQGEDGMLMGKFSSPQGELEIPSIMDTDGEITFDMNIEAAGQEMELKFKGMVDGDTMSGSFSSPFGDMPVSGTRVTQ